MAETLLEIVRRHTERACARNGVASTTCGLIAIRKTATTSFEHTLPRPLLCLVLQGSKRVSIGNQQLDYAAGDSMLITANQPMASQIMQASASTPYLSLALDLDLCIIADLVLEMQAQALSVKPRTSTYEQVADTALRLMQLLDRPAALALLHQQFLREIHYWLLTGIHGAAIRQLGTPDTHVHRIARSVAVLRAEYANALPAERLAAVAGMSRSSFHQHFQGSHFTHTVAIPEAITIDRGAALDRV